MMPKVLLFTRRFSDSGVTRHVLTLSDGLARRGVPVAVLTGERELDLEYAVPGVALYTGPFLTSPTSLRTLQDARRELAGFRALNRLVREFRPDVIHVHWRSVSPYARLVQACYGIPFVTTLHQTGIPTSSFLRSISFWGNVVIAPSRAIEQDLIHRFRVHPSKIRLVENGFDDSHFRPPNLDERQQARESFGIAPDALVVSMIGSINHRKRQDVLIQAIGVLESTGIKALALIAGRPTTAAEYQAVVAVPLRQLNRAEAVQVVGFVEARRVLWASDILVLPSETEAFPSVIVEAMLCGVVPIRTPTGGTQEQFDHDVEGFVIPFGGHAELAHHLAQLATDPDLRKRMSDAAVRKARRAFTIGDMTDRMLSVYSEVVARKPAPE